MLLEKMKFLLVGAFHTLLCILIVNSFGWTGVLVALPIFFLVPFLIHYLKKKWERRNSLS
jgi:hypothetical protein